MKKLLLVSLALVASLNLAQAQDQCSYWSEVALVVEPGKAGLVATNLVDDFYSSIEFPEGHLLTLECLASIKC